MSEPSEELIMAYGRMHYWYNQTQVGHVAQNSEEFREAAANWKNARIELELMQRKYNDKPYYDTRS